MRQADFILTSRSPGASRSPAVAAPPPLGSKAAKSMEDSLQPLIHATIGSDTEIVFKSKDDYITEWIPSKR